MARFKNHLWTDVDCKTEEKGRLLLAATTLWLRAIDSDIGWANMIRLFVPFSNDLYFGTGVPLVLRDRLAMSDGRVLGIINCTDRIAWVRGRGVKWLPDIHLTEHTSQEVRIHMDWLEWALGTAIVMLWEADVDWIPRAKQQTIGGLEVADFSECDL